MPLEALCRSRSRFATAAALAVSMWIAASSALPQVARANDSTATLGAGGLTFTPNRHIRIVEEDLTLSAREVRIRYRFRNVSDRNISTLVAFPLPDIDVGSDTNYSITSADPVNFVGFEVVVNGRPVTPKVYARATRNGVDVTGLLKRHGIPLTLFTASSKEADALFARLNGLPAQARAELERHGVMDWSSQWGAGNKPLANPHWTAEVSFGWMQAFPPKQDLIVEHRYRPVVGESFFVEPLLNDAGYRSDYCIDSGFASAAKRRLRKTGSGMLLARELKYVLVTANNWLGPIGRFRLTIDKGSPRHLVSLCIDRIAKTGPTTFVFEAEDYAPKHDLRILFLERPPRR